MVRSARAAARVSLAILCLLPPAAGLASIECADAVGEIAARIIIDAPEPGAVIAPTTVCSGEVTITGTFFVKTPLPIYDFYIVLDTSGSTADWAGVDVDGDGLFPEIVDDSIYRAEIAAAQAFVRGLDPAACRAAIISFASVPTVRQSLTADLAACDAVLEAMKAQRPGSGTAYVPAMGAVETQVLTNGDPGSRRQRCIFLSDGEPNEGIGQTDAAAQRLDDIGIDMDTFSLGFGFSQALANMARITGGTYTELSIPGDIVDLLPSFLPNSDYDFDSANDTAGSVADVTTDDTALTFTTTVALVPGLNHVVLTLTTLGNPSLTLECTIDLEMPDLMTAVAGADRSVCSGERVLLDGGASTISPCGEPRYRWLDCVGNEACTLSDDPTCLVDPCGCDFFTLEVSCFGETCTKTDTLVTTCLRTPAPVPALVRVCGLDAEVTCGLVDPTLVLAWDLDLTDDADADGDPANDEDVTGCDVTIPFATPGAHVIRALTRNPATSCGNGANLPVGLPDILPAGNVDGGSCPETDVAFACGVVDPLSTFWWDFDALVDSDLDGDPANDADASGCDVVNSWSRTGSFGVRGWQQDASGCVRQVASGTFNVSPTATPAEPQRLMLRKAGDGVTFTWQLTPGSLASRLLRGTLDSLWSTMPYDHAADDSIGQGACSVVGANVFTDPDDVLDPAGFYYLVTDFNDCGGEGPTGFGWNGFNPTVRPPRLTTPGCP